MKFFRICSLAAGLFFLPVVASAQVGATTDIIMGRVTSPDGKPVVGARVEVTSAESQIVKAKTTNADGRYSILFPDGGGAYRVQIIAIGYAPQRFNALRQGDEDRLVYDVVMGRNATVLQSVQVRAGANRPDRTQRPEAGGTERALSAAMLDRLPIDAGDLNAMATLAPGVIGVAATDSTPAAFSVAGQPENQNSLTLDGLTFGAGSVPQEAIKTTRVITSTYDVSRGQFVGGQIASTTRGGTNVFQGAINYGLRDPALEFVQSGDDAFSQKFTQNQISTGFGGPIVRNKFFGYAAFTVTRRTDPLQSLLAADPLALQRLGTNPDSVTRFTSLLNRFGLQPTSALIPDQRLNNNGSALVRLDYNLGEANTLMLRGDWRGSLRDGDRITAYSVPHTGGNSDGTGGGGMVMLTTHLGNFINEGRVYSSIDKRNTDPYVKVPSGRVTVASELSDGTLGISTLQFGVNPGLPQASESRLTEFSDEISRVSSAGGHRFKLGLLLNQDESKTSTFPNALGTFAFNSLADFENGVASSFTRTLAANPRNSRSINSAAYLGDAWRVSPKLQITYGVRAEHSIYPDEPAFNPAIDSLFGHRTDFFPRETHVSPRVGFTYTYGFSDFGPPTGSLRGGIGEFRGKAPTQLFAAAVDANGLANGQSRMFCVGSAVPVPDWPAYAANPASVPSSCIGSAQQFANNRRNVTVFDDGFAAPRAWRGSLGFNQRIVDRFAISADASFAYGVAQTGARDLNLDATPKFVLSKEGGRPVFAPIASIVPETGAISLTGSRIQPRFGVVSEVNSLQRSDTKQLTVSINGTFLNAMSYSTSYTLTRSIDEAQGLSTFGGFSNSSFGGGGSGASTAGNPNTVERGTSDQERRHSFIGTFTWPVTSTIDLTAIGRMTSGGFFTPIVGDDINGDGIRNDRPYIFAPSSAPDTAIGNGMSRLLSSAPPRARECLASQTGTIAGRNSCSIPWTPAFDLQMNITPTAFGLDRRLMISLVGINTLTGIDQLLHGDHLRGWGQPIYPDRTLLYVRGFDPVAQRFLYQVNEHFGAGNGSRNAFRAPFAIALNGRVSLGADPLRQQMAAMLGRTRGSRPTAADYRDRLARSIPNPFKQILDLNDSLKLELTDDQKAKMLARSDTLQAKADTVIGALAQTLGSADTKNTDPRRLLLKMRGKVQEGRNLAVQAVKDAEGILTPEQWAKVPKEVKELTRSREGESEGRSRPPRG